VTMWPFKRSRERERAKTEKLNHRLEPEREQRAQLHNSLRVIEAELAVIKRRNK
jgi:hypothetical protein